MTSMRDRYIGQAAVQVTQLIPAAGLQQQLIIRSFPHAAVVQRWGDGLWGPVQQPPPPFPRRRSSSAASHLRPFNRGVFIFPGYTTTHRCTTAAIVTRGKYQLPDVLFPDQSTRKNPAAVNLPSFPCRISRITGILFWWALLKMRNCLLRKLRLRCGICGSAPISIQPHSTSADSKTIRFFMFPIPLPDEF